MDGEVAARAGRALLVSSALTLDEGADLVRRCEEDQCPVTDRPGWQDDRLAAEWPCVTRINPEPEIGFQEFNASTVGRDHAIDVVAIDNRLHPTIQPQPLKVLKLW